MKRLLVALLLGGFVAGTFAAPAVRAEEKKKPTAEERFKKLDSNNDKKLTKEEFTAKAKDKDKAGKRFDKLDKNSDKSLSLEEFKGEEKPKKS